MLLIQFSPTFLFFFSGYILILMLCVAWYMFIWIEIVELYFCLFFFSFFFLIQFFDVMHFCTFPRNMGTRFLHITKLEAVSQNVYWT